MIKFRTKSYGTNIDRVEVSRESESSVWIERTIRRARGDIKEERRVAKSSTYENYHDTWEVAKQHLLKEAESKVLNLRRQLEIANGALGNIKGMKQG